MPKATEPPKAIALPDWGTFVLEMYSDSAYQRISAATQMQQSVSRIETFFAVQGEMWELAAILWQGMITGCPPEQRPTEAEVARWQEIADNANMPISFRDGMLRYVLPAHDS